MAAAKAFKTRLHQVDLLESRGMLIRDRARAKHLLHQLNYYRLSGYWYPMRCFSPATRAASDQFRQGASFELVVNLYKFDDELRRIVFVELGRLELAIRSMNGHELGRIDPLAHLNPASLGAPEDWNEFSFWKYEAWPRDVAGEIIGPGRCSLGDQSAVSCWLGLERQPWTRLLRS